MWETGLVDGIIVMARGVVLAVFPFASLGVVGTNNSSRIGMSVSLKSGCLILPAAWHGFGLGSVAGATRLSSSLFSVFSFLPFFLMASVMMSTTCFLRGRKLPLLFRLSRFLCLLQL